MFTHHSSIYTVDPLGKSLDLVTNTTAASGLDFHYAKNILFWSDVETRKVSLICFKSLPYDYTDGFVIRFIVSTWIQTDNPQSLQKK